MKTMYVKTLVMIACSCTPVGMSFAERTRDIAILEMTGSCFPSDKTGGVGCDLSKYDLSNRWLHGSDLSYANLTNANLSNTRLFNTNFIHGDLTGANLEGAYFYSNCTVTQAHFTRSSLDKAIFVKITGKKAEKGTTQELITWLKNNGAIIHEN